MQLAVCVTSGRKVYDTLNSNSLQPKNLSEKGINKKRARIEIQPSFNPIFYEKPLI
jgi:hypothetical protein